MDGYAVRCADVVGGKAELRVIGEIPRDRGQAEASIQARQWPS